MTDSEHTKFCEAMLGLAELFDKELTPTLTETYWNALRDEMTLAQFQSAVKASVKGSTFMPRPAQLIEAAGGGPDTRASQEFDKAYDAAKSVGQYKPVVFADPATSATIKSMGGWHQFINRCRDNEQQWVRREWISTWTGYDATRAELPIPMPYQSALDGSSGDFPAIVGGSDVQREGASHRATQRLSGGASKQLQGDNAKIAEMAPEEIVAALRAELDKAKASA